LQVEQIMK